MSVTIAGWRVSVEAAARGVNAAYGTARYGADVYAGPDGLPAWIELPETTVWKASRGVEPAQSPGAAATAGRLEATFYDPDRTLDPTVGTGTVLEVGAPIRVVARKDDATVVVWLGTVDAWSHDTLTGDGSVSATDLVAHLAGFPLVGVERPTETARARVEGLVGLMPEPPPLALSGTGRVLAPVKVAGDLWSLLAKVIDTDQSLIWIGTAGDVRWNQRTTGLGDPSHWSDLWDGATPVYVGLPTGVSDEQIVNVVEAQRVYPEGQSKPPATVFENAVSRDKHDPQKLTNNDLQLTTDDEVADWAGDVLQLRAFPIPAPTSMKATAHTQLPFGDATLTALLALDVGRPLRIHLASRGPEQVWDAVVAGLEHEADTETWTTTVRLSTVKRVGQGARYNQARYDIDRYNDQGLVAAQ